MKAVYIDSSVPEKIAKEKYCFPENIMMENAASSLEILLRNVCKPLSQVIVFAGTGNNGGDGYALSRRIAGDFSVKVYASGEPKTSEAAVQKKMAGSCGVQVKNISEFNFVPDNSVFVDCLYGTGFHGELPENIISLFEKINSSENIKISCDIPSGIEKSGAVKTINRNGKPVCFKADYTVTMGALKLALFSDAAKDFSGKIIKADLGISEKLFEDCVKPDLFMLEEKDEKLPYRKQTSSHKGSFGHAVVVTGEKPGAAVIAGTASLKFGAGLVTLISNPDLNEKFLMSPELMISEKIPENATSILLGSGFGRNENQLENSIELVKSFLKKMKNPSVVLDADFFYYSKLEDFLEYLCEQKISTVLTPHPKELLELFVLSGISERISMSELLERRFELCKIFAKKYPGITLVSKSSVTFIFRNEEAYVFNGGNVSLAKAGSGDVLAGLIVSLLAQGYDSLEASKTSVIEHGKKSGLFSENYSLTPLSLIDSIYR